MQGGALVIGKYIKEMMDVFFGGDMKKAISIHQRITPFYKKVFGLRQNPIPMIKEALHQIGIDVGVCRRPLVMANEQEKKTINETLKQLELL